MRKRFGFFGEELTIYTSHYQQHCYEALLQHLEASTPILNGIDITIVIYIYK